MMKKIKYLWIALLLGFAARGQTVQLQTLNNALPGTRTVQLNLSGFSVNVGAISIDIAYDSNLLTYTGGDISYGGATMVVGTTQSNLLKLSWFKTSGVNVSTQAPINLTFSYLGGFSTNMVLQDVEIANVSGGVLNNISKVNGAINPANTVANLALAGANAAVGQTVALAMNAGPEISAVTSMQFVLQYNPAQLQFQGLTDNALGFTVGANNGIITMSYYNPSGTSVTVGNLPKPNFTYLGGGSAAVNFMPGSLITTGGGSVQSVGFSGGTVQLETTTGIQSNLIITTISNTSSDPIVNIEVPINLSTALSSVGAVDLVIQYDANGLLYKGAELNQMSGAVVFLGSNFVRFLKYNVGGNLDATPLITLKFDKLNSDISHITFGSGTMILNSSAQSIPVNFTNGSIAISSFTISGVLKYANTGTVRPISNSTVILKSADGQSVIATTITNAQGQYEITGVLPGEYQLTASTEKAWGGFNSFDDIRFRAHINGTQPLVDLQLLSADVDNNGSVNAFDGVRIRSRVASGSVAGWNRPLWNFEAKSVIVQLDDLDNIDIMGICTGDVNASYTPPLN